MPKDNRKLTARDNGDSDSGNGKKEIIQETFLRQMVGWMQGVRGREEGRHLAGPPGFGFG